MEDQKIVIEALLSEEELDQKPPSESSQKETEDQPANARLPTDGPGLVLPQASEQLDLPPSTRPGD